MRKLPADRPLEGVRVLLTRAREDSELLAVALERQGAHVLVLPAIEIVPPLDTRPLDSALDHLPRWDWIVFTSRNAVHRFFLRAGERHMQHSMVSIRFASVGEGTARALAQYGMQIACTSEEANAGALATALLSAGVAGQHVLIPAGDLARNELAEDLRNVRAHVTQIAVYRTVAPSHWDPTPLQALRNGEVDVIVVASPSAFTNLMSMVVEKDLPSPSSMAWACIGPTTAAAVGAYGLEPDVIARQQTVDGLVAVIISWNERRKIERI